MFRLEQCALSKKLYWWYLDLGKSGHDADKQQTMSMLILRTEVTSLFLRIQSAVMKDRTEGRLLPCFDSAKKLKTRFNNLNMKAIAIGQLYLVRAKLVVRGSMGPMRYE